MGVFPYVFLNFADGAVVGIFDTKEIFAECMCYWCFCKAAQFMCHKMARKIVLAFSHMPNFSICFVKFGELTASRWLYIRKRYFRRKYVLMVHYDIRETNESLTIVHALSVCFHKLCLRKWFEFNGFQSREIVSLIFGMRKHLGHWS